MLVVPCTHIKKYPQQELEHLLCNLQQHISRLLGRIEHRQIEYNISFGLSPGDMKQTPTRIADVCAQLRSDVPQNIPVYRSPNPTRTGSKGAEKGKESVCASVPAAKSETNNGYRFFLQCESKSQTERTKRVKRAEYVRQNWNTWISKS